MMEQKQVMITMKNEQSRTKEKEVVRNRREINKKIESNSYIEWLKKEYDVMDEKEVMLDKEFLSDIVREIERNRERKLVYTDEYKSFELNEWRRERARKDMLKKLDGAKKEKLKNIGQHK